MTSCNAQQCDGGPFRPPPALFPIPQRVHADTERDREVNFRTQADAEFVTRELASIRLALADVVTTEDLRDAIDRLHRKLDTEATPDT